MRQTDTEVTTVNGVQGQYSLLQIWVETVVAEVTRVVTWPIISLKQDDAARTFKNRMARDKCGYVLTYTLNPTSQTITGVTVTATDNTCDVPIPVTVPGKVVDSKGFPTEQVGNDPLTVWVTLSGSPVEFVLGTSIGW